ncbi:MAG: hypothetical protein ACR2I4_06860 [Actinomycetota bacterium]
MTPFSQVIRRMGHSDIRTTYDLYGHLFPDREDELVAKLNRRHDRALRPPGEVESVMTRKMPLSFFEFDGALRRCSSG